jgi:Flp pilus assembly protein TadG
MESERMGARQRHGFVHVDEEGVVAVVVAISLFLLFGAAALAIDLGSGWATKRDLNTDLDAAALAGARTLADETRVDASSCPAGGSATSSLQTAVESSVDSLVTANGDRATVQDVVIDCDRRTVRVVGSQQAQTTFAGVLGVNEINPAGYAVARAMAGPGRVLPLSLCLFGEEIQDFLAAGQPEGFTRQLRYGTTGFECGDDPANYGWWPSNSNAQLQDYIRNGLPAEPTLPPNISCDTTGLATGSNEEATQDGYCIGSSGHNSNLLPLIDEIYGCENAPTSSCTIVTFLVHDDSYCDGPGNSCGQAAEYRPYAFLDAIVRGVSGNGANQRLTLEFVELRTGPDETVSRASSSSLCSADGAPAGDPNCG